MLRQHLRSPGFWFDTLFVVFSVFLLPRAGRIVERVFASSFQDDERSFLIVTGLVILAFLGKWIAFALLGSNEKKEEGNDGYFVVWLLNLPSVILGMAFLIIAIVVPLKNAGIVDLTEGDAPIGVMGLSILAIEGILLYRLSKVDFSKEISRWKVLFSYAAIFGFVFLFQCLFSFFLSAYLSFAFSGIANFLFAVVLSGIVFVMFYVGPRSVLLFDEDNWGFAFLRMCLVFVVMVVTRLVLG